MPTKKPVKKRVIKKTVSKKSAKPQLVQPTPTIPELTKKTHKTNGFAIASLVLGIVFFFPFTSVLAIIFGIIGLDDLKKKKQEGKGLAITGIILGSIFFVAKILLILFLMAAAMSFAQLGLEMA